VWDAGLKDLAEHSRRKEDDEQEWWCKNESEAGRQTTIGTKAGTGKEK